MISATEAAELLESRDLLAIGVRADEVRRGVHGARTTFVRVWEVHVEAPPAAAPPGLAAGECRIVGRPESVESAAAVVRAVRAIAGTTPVTGFSAADLIALAGLPALADTCRALRAAGLEAISELPLDLLEDPAAVVSAVRAAGLNAWCMTVHALAAGDRVSILHRARDLQAAAGGFRAFAPLPRVVSAAVPSTGYDDVKQIALARLVADNIDSIQVDWGLYGPKLAQFALTTGADDVDRIAAVDPGTLGTRRSPIEEIRGNIRSASLEPVERNARFEAIGR